MLLREVVKAHEAISSARGKKEKVRIAAELLRKAKGEGMLPHVSRMLAGHIFPEHDPRELQIGFRTIWESLKAVSLSTDSELFEAYNEFGDLGKAAEKILSAARASKPFIMRRELSVEECVRSFSKISELSGEGSVRKRQRLLSGLLASASPEEARFLVKVITGDMRCGLKEGLLEEAIAEAFGEELEVVRRAHMLTSDFGEVAELASLGKAREAKLEVGRVLRPMLAEVIGSIEEALKRHKELLAEYKYDGARLQIHKSEEGLRIYTRRGEDVANSLPELKEDAAQLEGTFVIDGEIIAFAGETPRGFQLLIKRLRRQKDTEAYSLRVPLRFYAFDLLYWNNKDLVDEPLVERRQKLEELLAGKELKVLSLAKAKLTSSEAELREFYKEALSKGFEGLMLKNPNAPCKPGSRGYDWLKLKPEAETLDLVVVAVEYGHGRRARVLSDYTFAIRDKNDELKPIAKAYCGLTDKEIEEMTEHFKKIAIGRVGRKLLVRPEVVVEVAYGEIQRSPKYELGYALRFPRIKRIRWDLSPRDADSIEKLEELYERQLRKI